LEFSSSFKILPLQSYDGIVGMDWLSLHSPQVVDWNEKWVAFQVKGKWTSLQVQYQSIDCTMIQIHLLQDPSDTNSVTLEAVEQILAQFSNDF
jgi:hypothetical protein